MKVEMEIEIEALTGLHQIKGNLETKVKNLEAELSSTKLKVITNFFEKLKWNFSIFYWIFFSFSVYQSRNGATKWENKSWTGGYRTEFWDF